MIDFELVEKATRFSLQQLETRVHTDCPKLFLLDSILHPELLTKLYDFISEYSDDNWASEINQEFKNRLKLNWVPESVIEETHMVIENLTDKINEIFNKQYKFLGITVWKDRYGYSISKHIDVDAIDVAMQVYLSPDSGQDYGTEFDYNNQTIIAKYKQNSGYLLGDKIVHSMNKPVAAEDIRYSLYAIWQR